MANKLVITAHLGMRLGVYKVGKNKARRFSEVPPSKIGQIGAKYQKLKKFARWKKGNRPINCICGQYNLQ